MQLEELQKAWAEDAKFDQSELGAEALRTPLLHHKYWKLYSAARAELRRAEAELKKLKHRKYVFYSQGPSEETRALGWRLPPCGKVLKGEAREYVDTDDEVVGASLALGELAEKAEFLESIIKAVANRGFAIKSAIEWERFKVGS